MCFTFALSVLSVFAAIIEIYAFLLLSYLSFRVFIFFVVFFAKKHTTTKSVPFCFSIAPRDFCLIVMITAQSWQYVLKITSRILRKDF